jgi:hypothetical protein
MQANTCRNFNHGKSNAPVRVCPMCGEVVNGRTPVAHCSQAQHADRRKNGDKFCVDCGERLRVG